MAGADVAALLRALRLSVLERGWLSSNNVVLRPRDGGPVTVVDSGYDAHSHQTLALVEVAAGTPGVARLVNTHLHSDHCGGNAALQARWQCETWVPEPSWDAVNQWDTTRLTFDLTDQACRRFSAQRGVAFGETVRLADEPWQALHAPGHDPEAMMLFHVGSGVLIAGDALWESRLAIVFPELDGRPGFAGVHEVLDRIESLAPTVVIPGHGAPFGDVSAALSRSRERLARFEADPSAHLVYAARALTMFHMFERRARLRVELEQWLVNTPVFGMLMARLGRGDAADAARSTVTRLVGDGLLVETSDGMLQIH